jgi:hypothetical protein
VFVEFAFHIGGEASGVRIGVERSEQRLQIIGHHLVEQRLARIMGGIGGWCRADSVEQLPVCAL